MTKMQKSREYGEALFALATEYGACDEYNNALDTVSTVFKENPEYTDFLASPSIPKAERIEALETAFSGRVPEHIVSFLSILCERGRIREFSGCVREYKALLDASKNVSLAKVVSAVPLTDSQKEKLQIKLEKLSGQTVILDCSVDKSLLGGLIIETDGKTIDGSLKRRLYEVKEVISR